MMYGNLKKLAEALNVTPIIYSPLESISNNGLKFYIILSNFLLVINY